MRCSASVEQFGGPSRRQSPLHVMLSRGIEVQDVIRRGGLRKNELEVTTTCEIVH